MKTDPIRILGIDPGLRHTGWGVIDTSGSHLSWVAHGVISPEPDLSLAQRLRRLYQGVSALIITHNPHIGAVEETLVNAGARSALLLGQARGVAMVALGSADLKVYEYAPRSIKQAVVGSGRADKSQIAFMVKRLLPRADNLTSDAADALACAICCAHMAARDIKLETQS